MKTYPPDSVFVTGVARVSKEDAINAMYGTFTLSLVVDVKTGTIINCSANMIMSDTIDSVSYTHLTLPTTPYV